MPYFIIKKIIHPVDQLEKMKSIALKKHKLKLT